MSFIQPSGEVRLIVGYRGDKGYNHTVRFESISQQTDYFTNLSPNDAIHRLTNQKYVNYTKNSIRVQCEASALYNCNYMMFRNARVLNNKWFYAFIDSIDYVNNNMCEVTYTIDVIQSWWRHFNVEECFVEREHTLTDELFEHLIDEDLEIGEYINCWQTRINIADELQGPDQHLFEYDYWIVATEKFTSDTAPVFEKCWSVYDGIPAPYDYIKCASLSDLENKLTIYKAASKLDAILCVTISKNYGDDLNEHHQDYLISIPKTPFDGYQIKNNKLYTSPYFKIVVGNNLGSNVELNPELFDRNKTEQNIIDGNFETEVDSIPVIVGFTEVINTRVQSSVAPKYYKGDYFDDPYNRMFSVLLDKYPTIPWSSEALGSWLIANQNQVSQSILNSNTAANAKFAYNLSGTILRGAISLGSDRTLTNALGVGLSISSVIKQRDLDLLDIENRHKQNIAKQRDLSAIPPQASANSNADPILYSLGNKGLGFTITVCCPELEYLKVIDNYLSMYGYKVNTVKKPNVFLDGEVSRRPCWNYLKTSGANVVNRNPLGLPALDASMIATILDKGITFWEKDATIGNYSADNSAQPQT